MGGAYAGPVSDWSKAAEKVSSLGMQVTVKCVEGQGLEPGVELTHRCLATSTHTRKAKILHSCTLTPFVNRPSHSKKRKSDLAIRVEL